MADSRNSSSPALRFFTLALAAFIITVTLFGNINPATYGICAGSPAVRRIIYPFIHSSAIHAAVNAWCLLSIVFLYPVRWWMFAASFTIATLIPSFALSSIPTVGLSTFCFALLAIIVPLIRHKLLYNAYWAAFILFDFCVPSVNAAAHLFAYTAGLLIAAINTPLTWHPK